jgi:hypothetical protein
MEAWKSLDSEVSKISIKIMKALKDSGLPLTLPGLSSAKSKEEMMRQLASLMNHPEFPHKLDFQDLLMDSKGGFGKSFSSDSHLPFASGGSESKKKPAMMVF